jgi:hypothetical protein
VVPSDKTNHPLPYVRNFVSNHIISKSQRGSPVDRRANGGILGGEGFRIIYQHQRRVDVTGMDNHRLKMVDAAAVVESQKGDDVVIMRQYAYHGIHRTIHSSAQIEAYKNIVDDHSINT